MRLLLVSLEICYNIHMRNDTLVAHIVILLRWLKFVHVHGICLLVSLEIYCNNIHMPKYTVSWRLTPLSDLCHWHSNVVVGLCLPCLWRCHLHDRLVFQDCFLNNCILWSKKKHQIKPRTPFIVLLPWTIIACDCGHTHLTLHMHAATVSFTELQVWLLFEDCY